MTTGMFKTVCVFLILSILIVLGLLITVAFMTLVERKLISPIQNRRGPNTVGYLGVLQPFADAMKLIVKESIFPRNARFVIFTIAPLISLFFALAAWAFIPFSYNVILVDTNIGVFFIFVSSILHIYGVILSG